MKPFLLLICVMIIFLTISAGTALANDPPVAEDDSATTSQNSAVTIYALANDTDPDGDELYVYGITVDPLHGSAEVFGTYIIYTPDTDYSGGDSFVYGVTDWRKANGHSTGNLSNANKDSATVTISIDEVTTSPDQGNATISDISLWPLWPDPSEVSYNPLEPLSFTSVGRDVISYIEFSQPSPANAAWGGILRVMRKEEDNSFPVLTNDLSFETSGYGMRYYNPTYGSLEKFKNNDSINTHMVSVMRNNSVIPQYSGEWFSFASPDIAYPNQDFSADTWLLSWYSFLEGTENEPKAGETLADSGHGPPLLMWQNNYWITRFVDPNGIPEDWPEDEPLIFLPTNDGIVNRMGIENPDTDPHVKRNWAVIPGPSLQTSPYQEHLKQLNGSYYPRLTNLDGPIYINDIKDAEGNWKRILVGTTGMSTDLKNKQWQAWIKENNDDPSAVPMPQELDPQTSVGKHFGVYAMDITDPEEPVYLWDRTNLYWDRSDPEMELESENNRDLYLDYVCARPLIGMTGTRDNLEWHLLLVGMEYDENDGTYYYHWYDFDPLNGNVRGHARFTDQYWETDEAVWYILEGAYSSEEWDPSRMLAAYPKEPYQYSNLPVLSDVYVYLSNGAFYVWNLQEGNDPWKLFTTVTNNSPTQTNPAPPIQDFDIAYFDEYGENGMETHTYLAAIQEVDFNASNPHDTTNLFVLDLDAALGDYFAEDYEPKVLAFQSAQGQGGETLTMVKDRIDGGNLIVDEAFEVELQTGTGSNADEFDKLVAAPLFIDGVLYMAVYSSTAEGGLGLSRLYTLDMDGYLDSTATGARTKLEENVDFLDFEGEEFLAATIGSDGVLYIPKSDGSVFSQDLGIDFGFGESGISSSDVGEVLSVYWKVMQ